MTDIDFLARQWSEQTDVDWILITSAMSGADFPEPADPAVATAISAVHTAVVSNPRGDSRGRPIRPPGTQC